MTLSPEQQQYWEENGYLLLKGFYTHAQIDKINALVKDLWHDRKKLDANYVIDVFVETEKEQRIYFADAPKNASKQPYKLNDLYLTQELIRDVVAGEQLAPILRSLLGGLPMVCNSLNFQFGSQQDYHFDTFYMPSPTPNKMVASWIALEDATPDNGPLNYYPGSHKIPVYTFSHGKTNIIDSEISDFNDYINSEIEKRGLKPETFLANKGDVLIWHSQLFHGGSPIRDKSKTRKSLVTHYFTLEDFPDEPSAKITENSCYMNRAAQSVSYPFTEKKPYSRIRKVFA